MNKSQMAKLAAAAGVNGLMYDPNAEGVFGNVQGYTVTIMPNANNRVYYMLSLSVSRMGMAPNPADFKPLEKMNKVLSGCTVQRFRVNFLVKLSSNKDKMAEALHSALDTLITFLRTNGYTNCCEHCGRPEGIDAYTVSGNAYLLCEPCFGQVSEAAALQNQTKMQKQEQVLPGIVGALIGSLIGAVVIVIVGQLGYVAAVSGLVMAICTLKGYEMLGKKLGKDMGRVMAAYNEYKKTGVSCWADGDGGISVAGIFLTPDLYEERLEILGGKAGKAFADNKAVVVLDTEVTEELVKEGMARDFVRLVQNLRKEKNFDISDRIRLCWQTDDEKLRQALRENEEYIKVQVLVPEGDKVSETCAGGTTAEIEGASVRFDAEVVSSLKKGA